MLTGAHQLSASPPYIYILCIAYVISLSLRIELAPRNIISHEIGLLSYIILLVIVRQISIGTSM